MPKDSTSTILGLVSLLDEVDKLDPSYEIKKESNISDLLKKVNATKLYRNKLKEVNQRKENPENINPIFGNPTETGRYSGDWLDYTTKFDESGKAIPRGGVKGLVQAMVEGIAPQYAGERAAFQSSLKDLEKLAFEFGGQALTGAEKPAVAATFPTQYDDEPVFKKKYLQEVNRNIPTFLKSQAQNLIDMGYSEEGAMKLIQSALEETATEDYNSLRGK